MMTTISNKRPMINDLDNYFSGIEAIGNHPYFGELESLASCSVAVDHPELRKMDLEVLRIAHKLKQVCYIQLYSVHCTEITKDDIIDVLKILKDFKGLVFADTCGIAWLNGEFFEIPRNFAYTRWWE